MKTYEKLWKIISYLLQITLLTAPVLWAVSWVIEKWKWASANNFELKFVFFDCDTHYLINLNASLTFTVDDRSDIIVLEWKSAGCTVLK